MQRSGGDFDTSLIDRFLSKKSAASDEQAKNCSVKFHRESLVLCIDAKQQSLVACGVKIIQKIES